MPKVFRTIEVVGWPVDYVCDVGRIYEEHSVVASDCEAVVCNVLGV